MVENPYQSPAPETEEFGLTLAEAIVLFPFVTTFSLFIWTPIEAVYDWWKGKQSFGKMVFILAATAYWYFCMTFIALMEYIDMGDALWIAIKEIQNGN